MVDANFKGNVCDYTHCMACLCVLCIVSSRVCCVLFPVKAEGQYVGGISSAPLAISIVQLIDSSLSNLMNDQYVYTSMLPSAALH